MERMSSDGFSNELTVDDRWLRGLARRVVGDPDVADDVAQETWLRASRHGVFARGWLSTALRHVAIQWARGDARRGRRERAAATLERHDVDVAETAAQLSARSALVDAVLALEPVLRDVVLMRFYEDRSFDDVARALGVPTSTAKSREKRALELLRRALERRSGHDGRSCLALLVPYAQSHSAVAAVGGLAVSGSVKLGAGALVVAGVVVSLWIARDDGGSETVERDAAHVDASGLTATTEPSSDPTEITRESVAPTPAVAEDSTAVSARETYELRGRVVDLAGRAFSGAEMRFTPRGVAMAAPSTARALEDGTFTLVGTAAQGSITCIEPGTITVMTAEFQIDRPHDAFVVVATHARPLRGIVVGATGDAIERARVNVVLPFHLEAAIPYPLDRSQRAAFTATTSADGRFAFDAVPLLDDVVVAASAAGYSHAVAHADRDPAVLLRVELQAITQRDDLVMGQVVDATGVPVEGATVGAAEVLRTTDRRGFFGLPLEHLVAAEAHGEVVLRAGKRGHRGATFARPADGWPRHVTLVLGPPPLSIRGVVRETSGAVLAGVEVYIADPTVLGVDDYAPLYDEELASGVDARAVTAADGSFVLEGLSDRAYTLVAWRSPTLEVVRSAPVLAGSNDVVLEFDIATAAPALDGVVTARDGSAIAGARVQLQRDLGNVRYLSFGFGIATSGGETATGADGTFHFESIARGALSIRIDAANCDSITRELQDAERDAGRVVVVLERQCSFRVETTRVSQGSIELLGADERPRLITSRRANQSVRLSEFPLVDGKTPVLVVGDGATTLRVLDADRQEVLRVPVAFVPAEITVLRP